MIARAEYDAIQNCMKAVESQPTAYDTDEIVRRLDDTSFLVATSKAFWDDPQRQICGKCGSVIECDKDSKGE